MQPLDRADRTGMVCGALLSVCAAGLSLLFAGTEFDDAFIYARYGNHLARTGLPYWNAGEPLVEGFSSWLWTGVYALGLRLRLGPTALPRAVGVVVLTALCFRVARRCFGTSQPSVALAAIVLLAFSPDAAFYASSGMDHILWAFIVWETLDAASREQRVRGRHFAAASLGFFVRPEGFLLVVPLIAREVFDRGADRRIATDRVLWWALPFFAFTGVRRLLFGRFLPNAAAAKHYGGSLVWRAVDGIAYLSHGVSAYVLLAVIGLSAVSWRKLDNSDRRTVVVHGAFIISALGLVLIGGGDDVSAFRYTRLIVPIIAPATYVSAVLISTLVPANAGLFKFLPISGLLLLSRAPEAYDMLRFSSSATSLSRPQDVLLSFRRGFSVPSRTPLSDYLLQKTRKGESIAVPWAGRIPYETDLPTIDLLGLNDRHIAEAPPPEKGIDVRYDPKYVLAKRPVFICENFVIRAKLEDVRAWSDLELRQHGATKRGQIALLRDPQLAENYDIDSQAPVSGTCLRRRGDDTERMH